MLYEKRQGVLDETRFGVQTMFMPNTTNRPATPPHTNETKRLSPTNAARIEATLREVLRRDGVEGWMPNPDPLRAEIRAAIDAIKAVRS